MENKVFTGKPVLSNWRFDSYYQLNGNVSYDNRFPQGYYITTTPVVKLEKGEATTRSGTVYILGTPLKENMERDLNSALKARNENNPD